MSKLATFRVGSGPTALHGHAVEQWLDEGWSPWRIGYGLANLIAMIITVYVYARQPHHPGAIWWLMAAVAVAALWALGVIVAAGASSTGDRLEPSRHPHQVLRLGPFVSCS